MIKINDIINNINSKELDTFISKTDANFISTSDIKETRIDYNWLNVLEDSLSSIDKIVRNPRRFIIQEEDVTIVEKTKKISQSSIKHLAEHSENIQDLDKDNSVVPKKLLNVYKEDTTDLYENRFIYTLVKRLDDFINTQVENIDLISKKEVIKDVTYKANTNINNRKVSINLTMHDENIIELDKYEKNYKDRILASYDYLNDFKNSVMIKELAGCSLVRNPIRMTNLILREPNFQTAYRLWQFLDDYEGKEGKVINYEKTTDTSKETRDEFTLSYYIDCNAIDDSHENLMKQIDIDSKLNKIINEYIYQDSNSVNDFIEKTKSYYLIAMKEKEKRINDIEKIFNNFINIHDNNMIELNKIFD